MYNAIQRQQLLITAKQAIYSGLEGREPDPIDQAKIDPKLLKNGASFVTLRINQKLRGCIGSLKTSQALIENIASNAHKAAFNDTRFSPLTFNEAERLAIHISILSDSRPIHFSSQHDLLQQLRPGIDGLVLRDGIRHGTFLPAVWEQLPKPEDFFSQLKRKTGLPENYWSRSLSVERYTVESIEQER
jgi:AmmeMemoRadiSam system protein A